MYVLRFYVYIIVDLGASCSPLSMIYGAIELTAIVIITIIIKNTLLLLFGNRFNSFVFTGQHIYI